MPHSLKQGEETYLKNFRKEKNKKPWKSYGGGILLQKMDRYGLRHAASVVQMVDGSWFYQNILGQDTEPQIAPDVAPSVIECVNG